MKQRTTAFPSKNRQLSRLLMLLGALACNLSATIHTHLDGLSYKIALR